MNAPLGSHADSPEITTIPIHDNIYMLMGKGGNIGVITGEDGTFMIDDQFADMNEKISAAIKRIGGDAPQFIINTHFHGDHTGGNEHFGSNDAIFVAHDNVRKRLAEGARVAAFDMEMAPYSKAALPKITFTTDTTFHLNNETIHIYHVPHAHTDGDGIIHFKNANVIHAGDTFFNGFYPFIDVPNGGSVKGMIAAADSILIRSDDNTKIIPGHGQLANAADLQAFRDMLSLVQERLGALKTSGMSADDAIGEFPLSDLEEKWGNGIFTSERWIGLIYDSI